MGLSWHTAERRPHGNVVKNQGSNSHRERGLAGRRSGAGEAAGRREDYAGKRAGTEGREVAFWSISGIFSRSLALPSGCWSVAWERLCPPAVTTPTSTLNRSRQRRWGWTSRL